MSGLPYYKRYPSNALAGMQFLSLEERGAYNTLIDMIYDAGGPIRDDERMLRAYMNCDVRTWRRVRAALIAMGKIFVTDDGRLSNERAEKELLPPEVQPKFGGSSPEVRSKSQGKHNKNNGASKKTHSPNTRSQRRDSAPSALAISSRRCSPPLPFSGQATSPPEDRTAMAEMVKGLAEELRQSSTAKIGAPRFASRMLDRTA